MTQIIVLSGADGVGKDTFAKTMFPDHKRLAFADKLKQLFSEYKKISLEELEKNKNSYREEIKEYAKNMRKDNDYYFVDIIMNEIRSNEILINQFDMSEMSKNDFDDNSIYKNIIITDLRFQIEYNTLKKLKNCHFIYLTRNNSSLNTYEINSEMCDYVIDIKYKL